jgi:hypothetical protein
MDSVGERSEQVANWYFRLNGFLSIPGYVLHPDKRQRFPRTEADLIGVRFANSVEEIDDRKMADDLSLIRLADNGQTLFVLVEVKTNLCAINGPWSDEQAGNMQRVIQRLGFAEEKEIETIAEEMYRNLRWENETYVLQYLAVGGRVNRQLQGNYKKLVQITWDQISDFLFERFRLFPEKLPDGAPFHPQWPGFARAYCASFFALGDQEGSRKALESFIQTGKI